MIGIQTAIFIGLTGTFVGSTYSLINDLIIRRSRKFTSEDDVLNEFDKFLNRCKNKKKAHILFFLPITEKGCGFSFFYPLDITKENKFNVIEALRTNDFRKIITKRKDGVVDFKYMDQGQYTIESDPFSNRFWIKYD